MKYIKLFEGFINEIDAFDEWEVDEEEFDYTERTHRDIPGMPGPHEFDAKDMMRINNLVVRSTSRLHLVGLSITVANRITHIDKAVRRGNAAMEGGYPNVAQIFWDRAKKLYFG